MEQNKTIAVIGGTGKAGKFLVRELINRGFQLRLLTRNPDKVDSAKGQVEIITGDIKDYESVFSLLRGCSAVLSTLGQSKNDDLVFSLGARNIVRAMDQLNIKRYVVLTGLSIDARTDKKGFRTKLKSGIMKMLFGSIIKDKQKEFEILLASDVDWTVVRVPFIELTGPGTEVLVSLTDCPGNKISASDLACFMTDQIYDNKYSGQAPFIANIQV